MDLYQFIAAIVGHLAWPIVVIVLLCILRKHIGSLADRVMEMSFGGAKVTFDKFLQRGAEIIEHAPNIEQLPPPATDKPGLKPSTSIRPLPKPPLDPGRSRPGARKKYLEDKMQWENTAIGQIIFIYETINNLLFEIGDALGIDAASGLGVMHTLLNRGLATKEASDLYSTLSDARNLVVHAQALPSLNETNEYVRQAAYLSDLLIDVRNKVKGGVDKGPK